ncbi:MAG: TetR/AcrR family transcriptional regulator [Acidimicrobiales bacterium]
MDDAPRLRARQAAMSRELVLDTVVDLLEKNGLDGVSMPAIAKASGVSLRTLYRYFPTRDDLLAEAGEHIRDRMGLSDVISGAADIPGSFWANSARAARHRRLVRALVVTGAGRRARAGTRSNRVAAIQEAMTELTDLLPEDRARQAVAVITYLCSSSSWVTISDECGISALQARESVMWALESLLARLREEAEGAAPSAHATSVSTREPRPTSSNETTRKGEHR